MKAILIRTFDDEVQTLGEFRMYDGERMVFQCKTLELPWRDNDNNVSRIPAGWYPVRRRRSKRFNDHFHIMDVDDRTLILIHVGNYHKQTEGCVLLGQKYVDIDGDGHLDVAVSRVTINKLLEIAPDRFDLCVVDLCKSNE